MAVSPFRNPEMTIDFLASEEMPETPITPKVEIPGETSSNLNDIPQDIDPELSLDTDLNLEEEEEPKGVEVNYVELINEVADIFGGQLSSYEGYETDTPSKEMFIKLLKSTLEVRDEETIDSFVESMSEETKQIVEFDLNAKDPSKLKDYLKSLIQENSIKNLSTDLEADQEKILKIWYSEEGWSTEEISEKIEDLRTAGILEKEAKRIKPKLDIKSEAILTAKETAEREQRDIEEANRKIYLNKLNTYLTESKITKSLGQDKVKQIVTFLTSQEVPIKVGKTKELKMEGLEALVFLNKYGKDANIEGLFKAAYVLLDSKGFDEMYRKEIRTELNAEFINNQKYSSDKLNGKAAKPSQETKWILKVN